MGGVVIGDVPSFRVDNMPYGGVKDSGLGREGIRFAMEDMSEIRNRSLPRGNSLPPMSLLAAQRPVAFERAASRLLASSIE